MDELLGHPKVDPHGSPIPDKEGKLEWKVYDKLSDCKAGEIFVLKAVMKSEDEFLTFLNKREIKLGLRLKVKAVEPFDGSMLVSYGNKHQESLSHIICERLLGERV